MIVCSRSEDWQKGWRLLPGAEKGKERREREDREDWVGEGFSRVGSLAAV